MDPAFERNRERLTASGETERRTNRSRVGLFLRSLDISISLLFSLHSLPLPNFMNTFRSLNPSSPCSPVAVLDRKIRLEITRSERGRENEGAKDEKRGRREGLRRGGMQVMTAIYTKSVRKPNDFKILRERERRKRFIVITASTANS